MTPRPAPVLTAENAFYWEGAAQGRLLIQACGSCATLCHPPAPLCPACHSPGRVVKEMSGLGRVSSFMIVHHPPNPYVELPAVVAKITLDEGPTVISNLCDVPTGQIELGQRVAVFFVDTDQPGVGLPMFRPLAES